MPPNAIKTSISNKAPLIRRYCWCFRNPVNSPVEVGSLSHYLQVVFFVHPNGGWPWDFWSINSMRVFAFQPQAMCSWCMSPLWVSGYIRTSQWACNTRSQSGRVTWFVTFFVWIPNWLHQLLIESHGFVEWTVSFSFFQSMMNIYIIYPPWNKSSTWKWTVGRWLLHFGMAEGASCFRECIGSSLCFPCVHGPSRFLGPWGCKPHEM